MHTCALWPCHGWLATLSFFSTQELQVLHQRCSRFHLESEKINPFWHLTSKTVILLDQGSVVTSLERTTKRNSSSNTMSEPGTFSTLKSWNHFKICEVASSSASASVSHSVVTGVKEQQEQHYRYFSAGRVPPGHSCMPEVLKHVFNLNNFWTFLTPNVNQTLKFEPSCQAKKGWPCRQSQGLSFQRAKRLHSK